MTREEFIGRAAEGLRLALGAQGAGMSQVRLAWLAGQTLDAVGAWSARVTLEAIRDDHHASGNGEYCVVCDDFDGPNFPCGTRQAATRLVGG